MTPRSGWLLFTIDVFSLERSDDVSREKRLFQCRSKYDIVETSIADLAPRIV